jgi:hypothetical protein
MDCAFPILSPLVVALRFVGGVTDSVQDDTKLRLYGENESTVKYLRSRAYRGTEVAHIATTFYIAAYLAHHGYVELLQVPTADMIADGCTKPYALPADRSFCARLGLIA